MLEIEIPPAQLGNLPEPQTARPQHMVALDDGYDASDWNVTGSNGGPFTVTTPGGVLTGSGSGLTGGTFSVAAA